MTSATLGNVPGNRNPLFQWEFIILSILTLVLVGVMLEKPSGSIEGRIAMEQQGFNLYSYNLREQKVYAIAVGPRETPDEKGVWVNNDGTFRIDQLPVGEYTLKIRVPGFSTKWESGIIVRDGEVNHIAHPILLDLSEPNVQLASNTRVFTTQEEPRFWLNCSGASNAKVRVYKTDMLKLMQRKREKDGLDIGSALNIYKPYRVKEQTALDPVTKGNTPIAQWERKLATDTEDWAHEEFKFDKPLAPGDYMAVVEASNARNKSDWNVFWFSVSDFGVIVKQDQFRTVARAIDLRTLQPVSNAQIQLYDRSNANILRTITSAKTGADGFADIALPPDLNGQTNLTVLVYGTLGGQHAYGGISYYGEDITTARTYFYTDRPVYRLGQTVYYKGIARVFDADKFKNPGGGLDLEVRMEDPDNNEIWSGHVKTSKFGTFHGVLDIPKDGKTGAYQVNIQYPDGSSSYERFEVAEYRKPEYMVEVRPELARVEAGDRAKVRIHAQYYFGAPVANARVKYTVYSAMDYDTRWRMMDRPEYYAFYDSWQNEYYDSGYSGDYITEGYAETDANGDAIVMVDTKKPTFNRDSTWDYEYQDKRYKVDVEVTDLSRMAVLSSGAFSVTPGNFALFVNSDYDVVRVGEPMKADIRAVSYENNGQPMANVPVNVRLFRRIYDSTRSEYVGVKTFENVTVTTDDEGKAHVDFKTKSEFPTDTYYISAVATDKENNIVYDQSSVWVVSEESPYVLGAQEAKKEPLSIKIDKPVYKPGDKARVIITAPVTGAEGAQAIVSVEGPKLYNYQVVPLKSSATLVEIPLTKEYAPNVFVSATFVGAKHQFQTQSEMLKVSPNEQFLNISVSTDKPKYKPGEKATYTVKVTNANGSPAANAELSLGIVDESIYAIRPEATEDIRKFFYRRRENRVQTFSTFPEEYSGGPNKIEPRVRKDFRDTAAWLPDLVTDANGIATAQVKLPDNLTTWRATVRAITNDTKVGATIQKVISTQDLIVRLALPRFFTMGDKGYLTAVVHNYTEQPQAINVSIGSTKQFHLNAALNQTLNVAPDKASRFSWPVDVVNTGEATVTVKAVGQTDGDAMQLKVPVRPYGVQETVAAGGVLVGEDQTVTVAPPIPNDVTPGSVSYELHMSNSALGPILGNFSSLIDYPYGCTEQTMSRLMPSVVAIRINKELGVPLSTKDKAKFNEVYKQAMTKLNEHQSSEGGWGWWSNDAPNMYLTSLVLEGYSALKGVGYAVDQERTDNGLRWLGDSTQTLFKQMSDPKRVKQQWNDNEVTIDLARACNTLAMYNKPLPSGLKPWVQSEYQKMTPETLSYFCNAFKRSGDAAMATTLCNRLIELANVQSNELGSMMDWSPSRNMDKKLGLGVDTRSYYYSYRYTGVETTALAMETLLAMQPNDLERLESIRRWILLQRGKDGWDNTKTTAQVLDSFTDVEIALKKIAPSVGGFSAQVAYGNQSPQTIAFPQGIQPNETVLPVTNLSGNKLTIHKKGGGRLYYTAIVSYFRQPAVGTSLAAASSPQGLNVRRQLLRVKPTAPDSEGKIHFKAEPIANNTVRAGETILMKVTIDSPIAFPYSIMETPLPSGGEIVSSDPRKDAEDGDAGSNYSYDWGNWWWTHQDVLDDKVAFFVTSFPSGKVEFTSLVRMEMPGKFRLNPVNLQGMYTKAIQARSNADEITVTE